MIRKRLFKTQSRCRHVTLTSLPASLSTNAYGRARGRSQPLPSAKLRRWHSTDSYNDRDMNATFTAVVKQGDDWWIGLIKEVPGGNHRSEGKRNRLKSLRDILVEACHSPPAARFASRRL